MDTQLKKGLLDVCVLKCLSYGDSYGYKLMNDVAAYIDISESALYAVLKRLEQQGLVTAYKEEHDGRLRKYYQITTAGGQKLQEFSNEFAKVERVLAYVLREES